MTKGQRAGNSAIAVEVENTQILRPQGEYVLYLSLSLSIYIYILRFKTTTTKGWEVWEKLWENIWEVWGMVFR